MINMEEIEKSIMSAVEVAIKDALEEVTPVKAEPYCVYSSRTQSLYISTTDDDIFDAYVPFENVINSFIDDNVGGEFIAAEYAQPFIDKLRAAADLIESKLDKKEV